MNVYLTGPQFGLAERRFIEDFAKILEHCYMPLQVILAQDRGAESCTTPDHAECLCCVALDAIDRSDTLVAMLDGADADSGTCIEMGYAKGKGKFVIGVRTDFRAGEDRGLNLMVSNICTALIVRKGKATVLPELAEEVADVLARHERPVAPDNVVTSAHRVQHAHEERHQGFSPNPHATLTAY